MLIAPIDARERPMNWGDAATWVTAVVAVVALVVAIRSDRMNTRAAADSAADAKRAVEAAERAADAAARQAEIAEAQATKYVPPWSLRWESGDTYRLANDGPDTEYDVSVRAPRGLIFDGPEAPVDVDARSAITFIAGRHAGTEDDTIVVTWHHQSDRSDERHTWRHPLPMRPPRR